MDIKEKEHVIFEGMNLTGMSKDLDVGDYYLGVPNIEKGSESYLKRKMSQITVLAQTDCKKKKKMDNIGGIFEFKKDAGGTVIIVGTSDLCLKENQKNKLIFKLFDNIVDYLLID